MKETQSPASLEDLHRAKQRGARGARHSERTATNCCSRGFKGAGRPKEALVSRPVSTRKAPSLDIGLCFVPKHQNNTCSTFYSTTTQPTYVEIQSKILTLFRNSPASNTGTGIIRPALHTSGPLLIRLTSVTTQYFGIRQ